MNEINTYMLCESWENEQRVGRAFYDSLSSITGTFKVTSFCKKR